MGSFISETATWGIAGANPNLGGGMLQASTLEIKDVPSPSMLNPVREKGRKARKRRVYINQLLDLFLGGQIKKLDSHSELAERVNFPQGICKMDPSAAVSWSSTQESRFSLWTTDGELGMCKPG